MATTIESSTPIDAEKAIDYSEKPLAGLDGRKSSVGNTTATVVDLINADEALAFITNHPRAAEITIEGNAILEDPVQLKKLIRKIDFTITPLLFAVYFLQFLDKTTLSYTAVMGIRTDTHLVGQDYSDLSMLFYIGTLMADMYANDCSHANSDRFPRCRVPYAVSCATYLKTGFLLGGEHYALGLGARLPCSMHHFRRALNMPNTARCL